ICASVTSGSCFAIVSASRSLVMIHTCPSDTTGFTRSSVFWIIVRSPSSDNPCFGCARRLRGQKRVPLPPARITAANSGCSADFSRLLPPLPTLLQLTKKLADPFNALVDDLRTHCVRQANMLIGSERLTWHRHNMCLGQQPRRQLAGRLHPALTQERAHVRIHVERALRLRARQPRNRLESLKDTIAQPDVVSPHLLHALLARGQRGNRRTLHHARRVRGRLRLQLAHRSNNRLRPQRKPRTPPSHCI